MKKKILIIVCAMTVFLCNVRNIYASTGSDVTRTSFGSYTFESFDATLTIPYFNITLPSGARGVVMIYNFDTTYSGTAEFIFNYTIHTYDWYLYSFGGTCNFQQSGTNYRMKMQFEECSGFGVVIVGPSGSVANQLVLDPNYNTIYNLTAVDTTHEDLEQLYSLIDTRCGNVETYLSTISANLNSIKGYVDGLEGNTDTIEQSLTTLINSLNNLVTNTDQLEGYTNQVESYLSTIATNTGVQNGLSLIGGITNLISLLSSTVQGGPSLFDVIDGILDTANSIQNLFDSVNVDNTDVVNAINTLRNSVLDVNSVSVPMYSISAVYLFGGTNTNTLKSNGINYYYNADDIKSVNMRGNGNGYYIAYGTNKYNAVIDSISSGTCTLIKQIYTYNFYWKLYYVTGTSDWWSFDISYLDNVSDTIIVPLYFGLSNFPAEVSSILGLNNTTNELIQQVITAIEDLSVNIEVKPEIVVDTSSLNISFNDFALYSYSAIGMFCNGSYSLIQNNGVFSYFSANDIKDKRWRANINGAYLIYGTNYYNANIDSITSGSITLVRQIYTANLFWKMYYIEGTSGWYDMDMSYLDNNANAFIIPLFFGYNYNLPDDILSIFGLHSDEYNLLQSLNLQNINNKLDAINNSINNLDLSVSVDVSNSDVTNITNNFDTQIDIVNNVEVDFNTSFDSSNELITDTDLSLNFENMQPALNLYHDIFSSFYNIDLFKYVLIICLVGGVVLVLLG